MYSLRDALIVYNGSCSTGNGGCGPIADAENAVYVDGALPTARSSVRKAIVVGSSTSSNVGERGSYRL